MRVFPHKKHNNLLIFTDFFCLNYRMISGILEVLDGCFILTGSNFDDRNQLRPSAITLATTLLTLPTASCIQLQTKSLLAALHPTRQAYHVYKVIYLYILFV